MMNALLLRSPLLFVVSGLNWEWVAELPLDSVGKVTCAGADFAICPANTMHEAFEIMKPRSPIPRLHIVIDARCAKWVLALADDRNQTSAVRLYGQRA
jgi:hypothetical protein